MRCVIIAAGMGSRLNKDVPKTLLPIGDETILCRILHHVSQAGIREFVIVVGYEAKQIQNYLDQNGDFGLRIRIVDNHEWRKGNGISVLTVEEVVEEEPFLLSMSDHIVSSVAIERIVNHDGSSNLLLVDPKVENVIEIDDATKVEVVDHKIVHIGKELSRFNGIDCGIFRLNSRFFVSMREQLKKGKESISSAIQGLILNDDMEAVFMTEDDFWIDIDTPESYEYALKNLD